MEIISQLLRVQEWPLNKPGDEKFFGYVVAVGIFPGDDNDDGMFPFADFSYGSAYKRYRLPFDEQLIADLIQYLNGNIAMHSEGCGIYGKLWIARTEHGYKVDLP